MLKLNNVILPEPSGMKVGYSDFDNDGSFRGLTGYMFRDRVRSAVVKIEVSWKYLTDDQLKLILSSIKEVFFDCYYLDPETNAYRTITVYVGDRSTNVYSYRTGGGEYSDISFSLIER